MTQQAFSLAFSSLTQLEIACTRAFFDRLDAEGTQYFSSDLFRGWKLERHMPHPEKDIGLLFAKLTAQGFIKSFGELPSVIESNHFRKNDMFLRTGKFERWLKEQQKL